MQQLDFPGHRFQYPGSRLQPVFNEASGRGAQRLHLGQNGTDTFILDTADNGGRQLQDCVGMPGKALKGPCHRPDLAVGYARHCAKLAFCLSEHGDNFRSGSNPHSDLFRRARQRPIEAAHRTTPAGFSTSTTRPSPMIVAPRKSWLFSRPPLSGFTTTCSSLTRRSTSKPYLRPDAWIKTTHFSSFSDSFPSLDSSPRPNCWRRERTGQAPSLLWIMAW